MHRYCCLRYLLNIAKRKKKITGREEEKGKKRGEGQGDREVKRKKRKINETKTDEKKTKYEGVKQKSRNRW